MSKSFTLWGLLPEAVKKQTVEALIAHLDSEYDQAIGVIAAEDLLEEVIEPLLNSAYNAGVEDAKKSLQEKIADITVDLDILLKS